MRRRNQGSKHAMNSPKQPIGSLADYLHHHFLWLLCASYFAAAVAPAFGQWLRAKSLGPIYAFGGSSSLSAPMLLLGLILFNAGLGVRCHQLVQALRRPTVLLV